MESSSCLRMELHRPIFSAPILASHSSSARTSSHSSAKWVPSQSAYWTSSHKPLTQPIVLQFEEISSQQAYQSSENETSPTITETLPPVSQNITSAKPHTMQRALNNSVRSAYSTIVRSHNASQQSPPQGLPSRIGPNDFLFAAPTRAQAQAPFTETRFQPSSPPICLQPTSTISLSSSSQSMRSPA